MIQATIIELLFSVFSISFAYFQVPVIRGMIDYFPINNPYKKPFHNRGWLLMLSVVLFLTICFVLLMIESELHISAIVRNSILFPFILAGIHWVVFDGAIGIFIHDDVTYIGNTSKMDITLKNGIRIKKAKYSMAHKVSDEKRILVLGEYAGLVKMIVVSTIILFINFFL